MLISNTISIVHASPPPTVCCSSAWLSSVPSNASMRAKGLLSPPRYLIIEKDQNTYRIKIYTRLLLGASKTRSSAELLSVEVVIYLSSSWLYSAVFFSPQ